MTRVRSLCRALGALCSLTVAASAADLAAPADPGGWFGSLSGGYAMTLNEDWQVFSDDLGSDYAPAGIDDGFLGRAVLGYRWSAWDVAGAVQYADFSRGDTSDYINASGTLRAHMWALDAQAGYNTMLGNADLRTAFGLRYAAWNNDVEAYGNHINHDFRGIGPMVEVDMSKPMSDRFSLETGLSAAVLFGKTKTNAAPGWFCDDCSTQNATVLNLEGNLGLGFNLVSARAVLGWQAQWWDNVNVAITDASGLGDNEGDSGHFFTGPYLEVRF
jgi:hypothetical protein